MVPITDSPTAPVAQSTTLSTSTSNLVAASTSLIAQPLVSVPSGSPSDRRLSTSKCLSSIRGVTARRKIMPTISRKRRLSPLLMKPCTLKECSVVLTDTLKHIGTEQRDKFDLARTNVTNLLLIACR